MTQLSPQQLQQWLADSTRNKPVLIDVREPWELQVCHIAGSLNLPMGTIPSRKDELDADAETVMICHHGARSYQTGMYLEQMGFARVFNLSGGVDAWASQVDPAMPTY